MHEHILEEDIYDDNGILLLSKGQKVTDSIIKKLKMRGILKPNEQIAEVKQNIIFSPIVQTFRERKNIRDDRILEYPSKILSTIISESKTKPWWISLNTLANYVDWLYAHSIDVAIISLAMAVELEYNNEELWNIGLGAFLHDIGKLLVPKYIIQKPGPLNDMETAYMRQHCELGMSSIKPFCLPKECTDIILHHHERLDGSGYPEGKKGEEICCNVRIVMIADVVDAITSGRPYRKSKGMDEAVRILRKDEEKYSKEFINVLERIIV